MIVNTILGELDKTLYKYRHLLDWGGGVTVQKDKETRFGIAGYSIQIPDLYLALRSGDLWNKRGGQYQSRFVDHSRTFCFFAIMKEIMLGENAIE